MGVGDQMEGPAKDKKEKGLVNQAQLNYEPNENSGL